MKKIFILLTIFLSFSQKIFADGEVDSAKNVGTKDGGTIFCPSGDCGLTTAGIKENLPTGVIKSDSIIEVIFAYIDFFMPFLSIFGFVLLVYAGFSYIFKDSGMEFLASEPEKIIKNVVIGFIIVFLSYSIVALMVSLKS